MSKIVPVPNPLQINAQEQVMTQAPDLSVILGSPATTDIALRKALRSKREDGAVIILDFSGRGAMCLGKHNAMGIEGRSITWCDLADRRRPVSFFRFANTAGEDVAPIFARLLYSFSQISGEAISEQTIAWASDVASRLAREGTIGLGALLRTLASRETRRWFSSAESEPEDYYDSETFQ